MSPRRRILNVALNESLLKARSAILESAGYDVVSALSHRDIEGACEANQSFDLVIIGHALPKPEKRRVMRTIRHWCGLVPILELFPHGSEPVNEESDDELPNTGDSETLLAKVSEVLAKKRKRRQGAR